MSIVFEELKKEKLLANIRGLPKDRLLDTCHALIRGGVRFLELTLNTEGALNAIHALRSQYEDVFVAAGTVMNASMGQEALQAGAQFLISPILNPDLTIFIERKETPVWMGAMTPTEIVQAYHMGAEVVKIYPAGSLGTSYFRTIREPFPEIPMIAAGGIDIAQVPLFLNAGALAVSLAGKLVDKRQILNKNFEAVTEVAINCTRTLQKM